MDRVFIKGLFILNEVKGLFMNIIFNPVFAACNIILFIVAVIMLVARRRKHTSAMKCVLCSLIAICIMYFVFVVWCMIAFNSAPTHEPVPVSN